MTRGGGAEGQQGEEEGRAGSCLCLQFSLKGLIQSVYNILTKL